MKAALLKITSLLPVCSLLLGSWATGATLSLNFESGITGWSLVKTGDGTPANQTYAATAAGGGSNGSGGNSGLGGVLISDNPQFGTKLPYAYLANTGSTSGLDLTKSITGSYDFKHDTSTSSNQYNSSAFIFGDISSGYSGSAAGQLLTVFQSRGGYANSPNTVTNGANSTVTSDDGSIQGHSDNVWYRASFTWTPTSGTTGDFSWTTTQLSNGNTRATLNATGFTFADPEAYFGFADMWNASAVYDNISITGTLIPEPSTAFLSIAGFGGLILTLRRRRG